jgi:glycosyltransferase involved in cell wall biosynthesis
MHICAMRVLYDHQVFSWQTYGGISRYIVEIAQGIAQCGQTALFPEHFYSINHYLNALPGVPAQPLTTFPFKGKKWLQERLGRRHSLQALRKFEPTVFHPTYFEAYFLSAVTRTKTPFVITIHDMIHERYGHGAAGFFSLDKNVVQHKRQLAQRAAAVVVVSENTRQDVLDFIPELDPAKIHTIHHGNSLQPALDTTLEPSDLPKNYLLFVGQRSGYKNFQWMVESLKELFRADESLHLVCVGGGAFTEQEKWHLQEAGIWARAQNKQGVSDALLALYYHRARCFIFPSQYEGFGIPVLEAFSCGCVTVLNRSSSLPEVGGDAALYFSNNDVAGFTDVVYQAMYQDTLREQLKLRSKERLQQFSWQKSATAHANLYTQIA